jgi:hypothetical protein
VVTLGQAPGYKIINYLNYYIYIGSDDSNGFYFGLMGDCGEISDEKMANLNKLLDRMEFQGKYYSWYRYKYFSILYPGILTLDEIHAEETIKSFLKEFWEFADGTYEAVNEVNES